MKAIEYYSNAKMEVLNLGYQHEINWQASRTPQAVSESEFLREAAWVIYCSGFREATVRQYFNYLSLCFCDWQSANEILINKEKCVSAAMYVLRYKRKHEALIKIAERISKDGFENFKSSLLSDPIPLLEQLPFIGPITAFHLAKNLGFKVAKSDRHLMRLQNELGFNDVNEMCQEIALASGDPIQVVDLVLWRYLERKSSGVLH